MKRNAILTMLSVPLLVILAGCSGQIKKGTSLFNGKDLSGWQVKCTPKDSSKQYWKVQDGCIVADSMGDGDHDYVWLISESEYSDFILRLKFQVEKNVKGNSGVQFHSRYDDTIFWLDGPQVDINPAGPWRTGMIWDETRDVKRWLWPDLPKGLWVNESMANPKMIFYYADQRPGWNQMEISVKGTHVRAILNGVEITNWDGKGILDDATHRKYNVGTQGHIALQIHAKDQVKIRFKDIIILN